MPIKPVFGKGATKAPKAASFQPVLPPKVTATVKATITSAKNGKVMEKMPAIKRLSLLPENSLAMTTWAFLANKKNYHTSLKMPIRHLRIKA